MTVRTKLIEARGLIEQGWTQDAFARLDYGYPSNMVLKEGSVYRVPGAKSYCLVAAATCAAWETPIEEPGSPFSEILAALLDALNDLWAKRDSEGNIIPFMAEYDPPWDASNILREWNDSPGRSKNEVLRLYDRAIELASIDPDDMYPLGRVIN